jgi:hypothetical protein
MSDIYNKNAREKALLEEAYGSIYNEGQFWGRDDLVKKYKKGEKGHRKFTGPEGTTRASIPPGKEYQKDIDKLLARGYTEVEDGEDAEMEFDERGFVKNTEAGYEREDRPGGEDHDKFVNIAHEALDMIKDELHIGGHGEDININELIDGHNQLSRALIAILGEEQAIDIMGGQAERQAEAEQDFKPADGREY